MSKAVQPSINLKLSEGLKEKINNRAALKGQTVSKYVRELLSSYFDGILCSNEIEKHTQNEFINSTEFLQLVVWMYSKRKKSEYNEEEKALDAHVKTLKNISTYLPANLSLEFDKVLFDVLRVKNEESKYSKDYKFAKGYSPSREFNFQLFEAFLLE